MTIYEYIAQSDPMGSKRLIESFGYRVTNPKTMGANLRMLVAQEGEDALKEIAKMHPDKELILEVCNEGQKKDTYFGADGGLQTIINGQNSANKMAQDSNDTTKLAYQTNAMMIVVALLVSVAVIVHKQK